MVVTPWGDSALLRSQVLPPGPAAPPSEVARSQRRRLAIATVAAVDERGYEGTRVSDLCELAGVSPRSFYGLFDDKRAAFAATLDALLSPVVLAGRAAAAQPSPAAELRASILALTAAIAAQPAAARMCLVEAYVAGAETAATVDAAIVEVELALHRRLGEAGSGVAYPREMTTALVAASVEVLRLQLLGSRIEQLPELGEELAAFLAGIGAPVRPLRAAARRVKPREEEGEGDDHAERAMHAFEALLVERGLGEVTMGTVAERAGMSMRTLYANFVDREQLMVAAVDRATSQAVAVALPAWRRGGRGALGVRAAFTALFGFLASRPNLTHALLGGAREGGAPALARRSEALAPIRPVLAAGVPARLRPIAFRVGSDAILGAILGLAARCVAESGPAALPSLVPVATFLVLAPALGEEQATAAAEGKSYRK